MRKCPAPRPYPHAIALVLILGIGACAPFPELGPQAPRVQGEAPSLLPLETLLAQGARSQAAALQSGAAPGDALTSRAAGLQARAAAMRGPILDPETRAKLAAAAAK